MPLAKFVALHEVPESECARVAMPAFAVVITDGATHFGASQHPLGATDAALLARFA